MPPDCHGFQRSVQIHVGPHSSPTIEFSVSHGSGASREDAEVEQEDERCKVAWLSHKDISEYGAKEAALDTFDFVLTDSLATVPFSSRRGRLLFLERIGEIFLPPDLDEALADKSHLLSVLLPAEGSMAWDDPVTHEIRRQALAHMPKHTFVDDGLLTTHKLAFAPYRFSLIADDESHTVSQALIRCLGLLTVPLSNGFTALNVMMPRAIIPYNRTHFGLQAVRSTLPDINHDIGWLWNYHRLLQDQLLYRYTLPFEDRLASAACTLCRLQQTLRPYSSDTVGRSVKPTERHLQLALVAIFSAGANFERRKAIRETWGRVLLEVYHLRVRFFLGEPATPKALAHVRWEAEVYGDLVILPVPEGYRMNSQKGLLLLEWCARHSAAEFLLKTDDDIYLRPAQVLEVLRRRPPFGYIWGYFDYLSPVPHEEGDPFYTDVETYPYPAFPPYARGLVRAVSMDVVRRIAAASHRGRLHMISGDDPCFGVHLRQLIFDSEDPIPLIALDDRDSYRSFAMEPSCSLRLWSHMTPRTWVVHHVTAEQTRCMWTTDVAAGYYLLQTEDADRVALSIDAIAAADAAAELATAPVGFLPEVPPLPDVCTCLLTGPLAEALANRSDKINASSTYQFWGDPDALDAEV